MEVAGVRIVLVSQLLMQNIPAIAIVIVHGSAALTIIKTATVAQHVVGRHIQSHAL